MSANAASAQSVTTTEGSLYDSASDIAGASAVLVKCDAASAVPVLVTVAGLHDADEYYRLDPGESVVFERRAWTPSSRGRITTVRAKTASGTATVSWAVLGD